MEDSSSYLTDGQTPKILKAPRQAKLLHKRPLPAGRPRQDAGDAATRGSHDGSGACNTGAAPQDAAVQPTLQGPSYMSDTCIDNGEVLRIEGALFRLVNTAAWQ